MLYIFYTTIFTAQNYIINKNCNSSYLSLSSFKSLYLNIEIYIHEFLSFGYMRLHFFSTQLTVKFDQGDVQLKLK